MPPTSEVAESCFDLLYAEMIKHYSNPDAVLPTKATLEAIGFQVGFQMVERLTRERARFAEPLDAIKFLCKDFWAEVFKKQVDNLKTNYRGVYVLQDNRFRWLSRVPQSPPPAPEAIARQLYFPCGLLRGALAALSVTCTVSAEVVQLPQCTFTVRLKV